MNEILENKNKDYENKKLKKSDENKEVKFDNL